MDAIGTLAATWLLLVFIEPPLIASGMLSVPLSHLAAAGMIFGGSYELLRGRCRVAATGRVVLLFAGSFAGLLAFWSLFSASVEASFWRTVTLAYYLVSTLGLAAVLAAKPARTRAALGAVIVGGVTVVVHAVTQDGAVFAGRLSPTPDYNPSWTAAFLAGAVIAATRWWVGQRRMRARLWGILLVLVLAAGVTLTQGRSAGISLVVGLIATLGLRSVASLAGLRGMARSRGAFALLATVGIGITGLWWVAHERHSRALMHWSYLLAGDPSEATSGRTELWRQVLTSVARGDFALGVSNGLIDGGRPPHNQYLTFLIESGGTLLVVFLAFHAWLIWRSMQERRSWPTMWATLFLPVFALGNDVVYYKYYWVLLSVTLVLWRRDSNAFRQS